jgi:putative flippase GtrA
MNIASSLHKMFVRGSRQWVSQKIASPVSQHLVQQFIAYVGVGALGTATQYLILLILVEGIGLGPVASSAAGYIVGAALNYLLNHRLTFHSITAHPVAMTKFAVVAAVGYCVNWLVMFLGTRWTAFSYLIVQMMATVTVLIWGFTVNSLWTFKRGEGTNS